VRAVIDTNVLIAGLFWHGTPHTLLRRIRDGSLAMVSSPALLAELADVIDRPKFRAALAKSNTTGAAALAHVRLIAEVIEPPPLARPVCRDPDDDAVLALAQAARVDLIVSGDSDLLTLASHEGIPILSPQGALKRIGV
jgi:putative PIN family toxin of toxin-antitoxin system